MRLDRLFFIIMIIFPSFSLTLLAAPKESPSSISPSRFRVATCLETILENILLEGIQIAPSLQRMIQGYHSLQTKEELNELLKATQDHLSRMDVKTKIINNNGYQALQILSTGDSTLNRFARSMKTKHGVHEMIYDPHLLVKKQIYGSFNDGRFRDGIKRFYISDQAILTGKPGQTDLHESYHALTSSYEAKGQMPNHPWIGSAAAYSKQKLPTLLEPYSTFLGFDEVKSHSSDLLIQLRELKKLLTSKTKNINDLSLHWEEIFFKAQALNIISNRVEAIEIELEQGIQRLKVQLYSGTPIKKLQKVITSGSEKGDQFNDRFLKLEIAPETTVGKSKFPENWVFTISKVTSKNGSNLQTAREYQFYIPYLHSKTLSSYEKLKLIHADLKSASEAAAVQAQIADRVQILTQGLFSESKINPETIQAIDQAIEELQKTKSFKK